MDDRTRPDTNVVLLRRKGDPSEAERERVASTIFAEPDDIATFSRGNLVPPRPDTRDADEELAPSSDPFFDRLREASRTDGTQPSGLADDGVSTDAYFDRLATQSPAEMSTTGAPAPAVRPMPGSAQLPPELAGPSRHNGRLRGRLAPPALAFTQIAAMKNTAIGVHAGGQATLRLGRGEVPLPEPLGALALAFRDQRVNQLGEEGWLFRGRHAGTHITADTLRCRLKRYRIQRSTEGRHNALLALAARLPAPILAERIGIHQARAVQWVRLAGATYADNVSTRLAT